MMTTNNDDVQNRTLTIEKTFDAPIQLVWDAWTQAGHVANWWAPPGVPLEVIEHEFAVGGKWKYQMNMPDGTPFISEGTFLDIVELQKIVTTADFKPMTENVEMHILFEKQGDKTHFTFRVIHISADYCKQQEEMGFYNGWGSAFTRLDELLKAQFAE